MKDWGHHRKLGSRFEQPGARVNLAEFDSKPPLVLSSLRKKWCFKCKQDKDQKGGTTRMGMWFCATCR